MQTATSTRAPLSPLLLSIAGRVGHAFEVQTMIAGFACHARGVALEAADAKTARAIVKSKRSHTVDFRVNGGKLLVKCSCPAESMGVLPCKHTWAALLEIDKQGGLGDLRTKRGPVALERAISKAEREEKAPPPAKRKTTAAKKKARR